MHKKNYVLVLILLFACLGNAAAQTDIAWTFYPDFFDPGAVTAIAKHGHYIWCGTEFGLYRWDTTDMSYEVFTRPGGKRYNNINDIAIDSDGLVWVGFKESGIAAFDGFNWINGNPAILESRPEWLFNLTEIEIDNNNKVWAIGSYDAIIYLIETTIFSFDGEWHSSRVSYSQFPYTNQPAVSLAITPDGYIWCIILANKYYLFRYDGETWLEYSSGFETYNLISDKSGTLWMWDARWNSLTKSMDHFLIQYSDSTFIELPPPPEFVKPYWNTIYCDSDNNIWVATEGGGLLRVHDNEASIVQSDAGSHWLTTMMVDNDGVVWAGRTDGGISRFTDGEWINYPLASFLYWKPVTALALDSTGVLWASTASDKLKFENGVWATKEPDDITPSFATSIPPAISAEINSFVATVSSGNWYEINVSGHAWDNNGTLWFTLNHWSGGHDRSRQTDLYRYDGNNQFSNYYWDVSTLTLHDIDSNDKFWFSVINYPQDIGGTVPNGILSLNGTEKTYFTEEDGLLSNTVYDIIEHDGRIWVATDIGICSMDSPTSVEEIKPQIFDTVRNFPNPFNPSTTIRYSVETEARTTVEVFSVTGQKVAILFDRIQPPGNYDVLFDGAELPSGLYFVRVNTGGSVMTGKMMLMK